MFFFAGICTMINVIYDNDTVEKLHVSRYNVRDFELSTRIIFQVLVMIL